MKSRKRSTVTFIKQCDTSAINNPPVPGHPVRVHGRLLPAERATQHAGGDGEVRRAAVRSAARGAAHSALLQHPAPAPVRSLRLSHAPAARQLQRVLVYLHLRRHDHLHLDRLPAHLPRRLLRLPQGGAAVAGSRPQRQRHAAVSVRPEAVRRLLDRREEHQSVQLQQSRLQRHGDFAQFVTQNHRHLRHRLRLKGRDGTAAGFVNHRHRHDNLMVESSPVNDHRRGRGHAAFTSPQ